MVSPFVLCANLKNTRLLLYIFLTASNTLQKNFTLNLIYKTSIAADTKSALCRF